LVNTNNVHIHTQTMYTFTNKQCTHSQINMYTFTNKQCTHSQINMYTFTNKHVHIHK